MKKRKLNLLLNIATLCLCVAAIAFGVYSAKTASLNVSGTVAFTAHNCKADIVAKVYGDAVDSSNAINADGTPRQVENAGQVGKWSVDGKDVNATMEKFYFSDMGEDDVTPITLTFTITNQSDFPVQACITSISATCVGFYNADTTTTYTPNTYVQMETKGETADLVVVLRLTDLTITEVSDLKISLKFEKYTPEFTIEEVTEYFYNESDEIVPKTSSKLVTTMGHSIKGLTETELDGLTEKPIRWYAFAVKGDKTSENTYSTKPADIFNTNTTSVTNPITTTSTYTENGTQITETWYSLYGVDMSIVSNYKNHTYWFIQECVVAGGYFINEDAEAFNEGIIFNPDDGYGNMYAQVNNNKTSNIYNYLNEISDYSNGNGFITKTGIVNESLYSKISNRIVDESYEVTYTNNNKLSCNFSSKFWLLNFAEFGMLCNQSFDKFDYDGSRLHTINTLGICGVEYSSVEEIIGAQYFLRCPNYSVSDYAGFVADGVVYETIDTVMNDDGIRSAFQITL